MLVVGLGNPGPSYTRTRHNVGFRVLDLLADQLQIHFSTLRYGSIAKSKYKGKPLTFLKPNTYVNLSGKAVHYWLQKERCNYESLLVVLDDLALPLGKLRLRTKGSSGGHNGLNHISHVLQTQAYARLRIGVGRDFEKGRQSQYVLGNFSEKEEASLLPYLEEAKEMVLAFCSIDVQKL